MPKFRNKKSIKNIKRQAQRRKDNRKNTSGQNDRKVFLVTFILFALGGLLSFINSLFAMLTLLFPLLLGALLVNKLSKFFFKKEFEYHSNYSGQAMDWSAILFTVPLLFIGLYPMFIIGEVADCYLGSSNWAITVGFCK